MGLFTAKKATLVFKRPASISTAGFCLNKKLCLSDYFFLGHYVGVHLTVKTFLCPRPLLSTLMNQRSRSGFLSKRAVAKFHCLQLEYYCNYFNNI